VNGGPARIPEDLFAGHIAESDTLSRVPLGTKLIPVVGISAGNIPAWRAAGAAGFGLGSSLFRPETCRQRSVRRRRWRPPTGLGHPPNGAM
jgi:2-keto-3-deoxy-6-phosphogluconate aldolase